MALSVSKTSHWGNTEVYFKQGEVVYDMTCDNCKKVVAWISLPIGKSPQAGQPTGMLCPICAPHVIHKTEITLEQQTRKSLVSLGQLILATSKLTKDQTAQLSDAIKAVTDL